MYIFGTFEFDEREGLLRREGRAVPLEPKPARALALLLSRAGELVTRAELQRHLWDDGTHVDFDRALAYNLGQVRQALGDSADNPRFVQTIPRRGVKFIAPVTVVSPPASSAEAQAIAPPVQPAGVRPFAWRDVVIVTSVIAAAVVLAWGLAQRGDESTPIVAVALFDNETGDQAYDRSLSRMTDVLVERLTSLGPQRVGVVGNHALLRRPRASRDLDAIERETNAAYVVLVQLQRRSPELSLLLQLIRMSDGVHIWVRRQPLSGEQVDTVDDNVAARIEAAVRRHVLQEDVEAP
jgi:DNA-binding winged helix-turn-helix (wHTH) protein/TolB-like protein